MADQQLVGIDRIVAALNKINTSIQKTQTYKDGNMIRFTSGALAGVVESAGIAATLGFLGVSTLVPGTIDATSGVDGSLDRQTGCEGSVDVTSTIAAPLDRQTGCEGSIDGDSGVDGLLINYINCVASLSEGVLDVKGFLNTSLVLLGSISGVSGAEAIFCRRTGSVAAQSGADGLLDLQPGLGSSVTEISGVAATLASLEVLTDLVGSIDAVAGIDGLFNKETLLAGSFAGLIGVDGLFDRQQGLIGSVAAISTSVETGEIIKFKKLAGTCDAASAMSAPKLWLE